MLYWRRVLDVVRGCQAPKRIRAKPGGARKRARWGYAERSCTSGLYSGSGLRPKFSPSKACEVKRRAEGRWSLSCANESLPIPTIFVVDQLRDLRTHRQQVGEEQDRVHPTSLLSGYIR